MNFRKGESVMSVEDTVVFEWDEKYRTGQPEVDIQHQRLFELGNELFASDYHHAKKCLMELYKYTRYHFESEESIMAEHNATNLIDHMELHVKLLDKLNDISEKINDEPGQFAQLKLLVYKWIRDHILEKDLDTWRKFTK